LTVGKTRRPIADIETGAQVVALLDELLVVRWDGVFTGEPSDFSLKSKGLLADNLRLPGSRGPTL
jgi:hypothetical protein